LTTTISTKELSEQLANHEPVVVDVRPAAAYSGWRLRREPRGGHIHRAVSFPLSCTKLVAGADLSTLLASKGIAPDRRVIVYGYGTDESTAMASTLTDSGFTGVATYEAFLSEWSADEALPMARLVNYDKLVHAEWLDRLISRRNPETYPGKGFVVLDVSAGGYLLVRNTSSIRRK
jgi:thiosulfate/3-mercaptopyruvate sulfurtransferase